MLEVAILEYMRLAKIKELRCFECHANGKKLKVNVKVRFESSHIEVKVMQTVHNFVHRESFFN